MYVRVCVCTLTHTYVSRRCTHTHTHTIRVCLCMRARVRVYIFVCLYLGACLCMRVHVRVYTLVCLYADVCICLVAVVLLVVLREKAMVVYWIYILVAMEQGPADHTLPTEWVMRHNVSGCAICQNYMFRGNPIPFPSSGGSNKSEKLKDSQQHGPRAYLMVVGWRHMCVLI